MTLNSPYIFESSQRALKIFQYLAPTLRSGLTLPQTSSIVETEDSKEQLGLRTAEANCSIQIDATKHLK